MLQRGGWESIEQLVLKCVWQGHRCLCIYLSHLETIFWPLHIWSVVCPLVTSFETRHWIRPFQEYGWKIGPASAGDQGCLGVRKRVTLTLKFFCASCFSELLCQLFEWEQGQIGWDTDAGGRRTLISPNNRVRCPLKDTEKGCWQFSLSSCQVPDLPGLSKGISAFDDFVLRHAVHFLWEPWSTGLWWLRTEGMCRDDRDALSASTMSILLVCPFRPCTMERVFQNLGLEIYCNITSSKSLHCLANRKKCRWRRLSEIWLTTSPIDYHSEETMLTMGQLSCVQGWCTLALISFPLFVGVCVWLYVFIECVLVFKTNWK